MKSNPVRILGIETSCDETAAGVVEDGRRILSNVVLSQIPLHAPFSGVVPEIASRAHVQEIVRVVEHALAEASTPGPDLDAIAVANRPGLIGALLVGVTAAKALAWAWGIPLLGVDHLQAHLLTGVFQTGEDPFPAIGLVISGGHTALFDVPREGELLPLGGTTDDAVGEAFDKVASILGLGYPGGPAIARAAEHGNPKAHAFPRPLLGPDSLDFSFSGLKTAALYLVKGKNAPRSAPLLAGISIEDVAASFQEAVVETIAEKVRRAARIRGRDTVLVGGGVASNRRLREVLDATGRAHGFRVIWPGAGLSTDNGVMVAALAYRRLARGERDGLDLEASPLPGTPV
ncbi:MAG: tRNA (adenosine(37)-N6)-threonylcarbamoyltransferase complex transferase subunit TsaD [Planctomycetes bacterium]|nr:tRNA (adenosine(37)-N6)-threonylcarbamoyltransferase complex transferase subunit TsaD [Planctomycetota bacterium]